jgi:cyclopropane fatty-acyl-phospholipid synthase-like methyltransferase
LPDQRFVSTQFPRSTRYNPDWVIGSASGGANALWLTEWLACSLDLQSGMRVLDLGCGRGASSVFLHKEFGVQVWASDLWFSASEKLQRFRDADVDGHVFPIHADARSLPFATDFFDVIVSIDAFVYFGTDDLYLRYLARFLKPGGQLGIAGAGLVQELDGSVPEHLQAWWIPDLWCLHSATWWRRHWERAGILDEIAADTMPDGWKHWLHWQETAFPDNRQEIDAITADRGRFMGYIRAVGRRNNSKIDDPMTSIPTPYTEYRLLR